MIRHPQPGRDRDLPKSETDSTTTALDGMLAILRRFLKFCETIEAVEEDLHQKIPLPNVPPGDEVKENVPEDEHVEAVRSYCERFEYASRRHTQFELIAEVGLRLGALRAIDLEDFCPEDEVVHLRHRPEGQGVYGTPLKNGSDGERS